MNNSINDLIVAVNKMMFHDSMASAQEKMTQVCLFLELHHLPPTPLNYQVAYTYISKTHNQLNQSLDAAIKNKQRIDNIFIENLYFEHLNLGHKKETELLDNVDGLLTNLTKNTQESHRHITSFANTVHNCVNSFDEHNLSKTKVLLNKIKNSADQLAKRHTAFKEQLKKAYLLQQKSQQALQQLRKQHVIDPQTGLYKRHYLNQQTQIWLAQDKSLCAIAIQITNFDEFNEQYGPLVGDVVLNRVASKVQKYVQESGLPGRTSKEEFTVLLADIDSETANVIAEKIKNSVDKLKFVSSKGAVELPRIALSIGICTHTPEQDFNELARKAHLAAHKAYLSNQSCYVTP